jgi:hypothetical protein
MGLDFHLTDKAQDIFKNLPDNKAKLEALGKLDEEVSKSKSLFSKIVDHTPFVTTFPFSSLAKWDEESFPY